MDAWTEVAHEYHKRVEPFTSQFLPFLLNRNFLAEHGEDQGHDLHYLRGKSVLDVATGTGAAALYAISKGAKVTATDFSEEMLKIAETRARRRTHSRNVVDSVEKSLVNFKPRLADGENLPSVWTDQFDITCSNFGVIYFSNVNRGIEEMVRCTKPGGKVCLSAWGQKEMTNAFRIFPAAIRICGFESKWNGGFSEKPNFFLPLRRISADKHLLYRHLYSAGLSDVKVIGPFPRELRLSSAEEYWYRFVLACPNVKRVVEHFFTKDERQMLKETVIQLVKEEAREAEIFNITETLDPLGSQCHGVSLSSLSTSKIENAAKSKVAIADSGATHHLWPDYSAFVSYKKVSDKFVSLADQSSAPIHGIGDIAVSLGGKKALIRNAYHVPSLKAPLYSLGAHRRLPGCSFVGNNDTFEITFPNFSLSVHDDVDSYLEYRPLGKNIIKISFDYIEPRPKSSTSITRKNDCIVLSAAAYIAFGTKEEPPKQIKM
jgi:ubiquinone/menaquinone biosynthesis C-methylase UbiE